MIVPVRIGGGIRTKILYAMAQGVPVISTTIGCEGIEVKDKESILIANDATSFASAIKESMEDIDATKKRIDKSREVIEKLYSQDAAGKRRYECYLNVLHAN
jgi:glycosyltransferase involved in cell wall biosynthesis